MQATNPHPMTPDEFRSFLRRHSLKATPQRLAVHKAMLGLGHACADMVAEKIAQDDATTVTVASVYNILTSLSLLGVYSKRLSANSKMYFDVNNFSHIHLYDTVNNEYKDVIDQELTDMVHARLGRRKFRGYRVDDIDIQILCHPSKPNRKKTQE